MNEWIVAAAFVILATGVAGQLLHRRTSPMATLAAVLSSLGGVAVGVLMLLELGFGAGDRLEIPGLPPDVRSAASVLIAVLNVHYAWTILQARFGVLTSDPAALAGSFRAACTLVLLNAPLIPVADSATGVIIAAAVTSLGTATAYLGGVAVRPAGPARRFS
jgi:hypothetical protein